MMAEDGGTAFGMIPLNLCDVWPQHSGVDGVDRMAKCNVYMLVAEKAICAMFPPQPLLTASLFRRGPGPESCLILNNDPTIPKH